MSINPNLVPKIKLSNGMIVPCMGMGTFGSDRFSPEQVSDAAAGALNYGYRMFDCAAVYGNEDLIGNVFRKAYDKGLVKREELTIMTKVWNDQHRAVRKSCLKSISNLQADYIDVYFIHWPFPNYHAPGCSVDARNPDSIPFSVEEFLDTYRQIEELVDEGLVKGIGISNMTIPKLKAVYDELRIKPVVHELEIHPCFQQQELFDYTVKLGIHPIGYMPIGSPKRPERDIMAEDIADIELPEMQAIAKAHDIHPAVVALKWAIRRGEIVIPFSVNEKNYAANLQSTLEYPLTDDEMATIATLERNNRLVKGQVFLWEGAKDWHDLWDEDGTITK
ncbi:MAG: aldo/keto reductase [Suipraeoptans sp.]